MSTGTCSHSWASGRRGFIAKNTSKSGALCGMTVCAVDGPRDGPPGAQKNVLKPWPAPQGCWPDVHAEFVVTMEDGLDLDEEPYDPTRPQGNGAETSKQLIAEPRVPLPPTPSTPARYDYAYQRNG